MSLQKLKRRTFILNIQRYKVNKKYQKFWAMVLEVTCAQNSISINSTESSLAKAQPMLIMNSILQMLSLVLVKQHKPSFLGHGVYIQLTLPNLKNIQQGHLHTGPTN
ncbi:hypothetical protein EUGRSUZ_B02636 [Eucalyptus grandis]|uniref:Uncharacterized protein n=2 Tax=Eucalyptus grandis TaxID=71139 RepID=A0ACC3LUD4_EUCGR|nr:hypothetical protein EUGRSUZ_B02636 [Eucalyptus grandis]